MALSLEPHRRRIQNGRARGNASLTPMLFRPSPTKKRPGLIEPCIPTLADRPPLGAAVGPRDQTRRIPPDRAEAGRTGPPVHPAGLQFDEPLRRHRRQGGRMRRQRPLDLRGPPRPPIRRSPWPGRPSHLEHTRSRGRLPACPGGGRLLQLETGFSEGQTDHQMRPPYGTAPRPVRDQ